MSFPATGHIGRIYAKGTVVEINFSHCSCPSFFNHLVSAGENTRGTFKVPRVLLSHLSSSSSKSPSLSETMDILEWISREMNEGLKKPLVHFGLTWDLIQKQSL